MEKPRKVTIGYMPMSNRDGDRKAPKKSSYSIPEQYWHEKNKDQDFLDLKDEWYDKLKLEGFKDIESSLEVYSRSQSGIKKSALYTSMKYQKSIEIFYKLCRTYAVHGVFRSEIDKILFKWYAEGVSYRKMAKKLQTYCDIEPKNPPKGQSYKERGIVPRSIKFISVHMNRCIEDMYKWNNDPTNEYAVDVADEYEDLGKRNLFNQGEFE